MTDPDLADLEFNRDGAALHRRAVGLAELATLEALFENHLQHGPGTRLAGTEELQRLLTPSGHLMSLARGYLGMGARAVRALLFDKRADQNWALGWHQDRTIVVEARHDVKGFGSWSMKGGLQHVEPPFELIAGMVTLRLHLDPCDNDNAPLLIAPGSQGLGRVPVDKIDAVVGRCGVRACLAEPGDVWAYATAIVHASDAATRPRRRRVLQIDFATADLPGGLVWRGV
jgi:hypothetical protein